MPTPQTDENKGFHNRDDAMDAILSRRQEDLATRSGRTVAGKCLKTKKTVQRVRPNQMKRRLRKKTRKVARKTPTGSEDDVDGDEDAADDDETVELVIDGEKKSMKMADVVKIAQKKHGGRSTASGGRGETERS